jgi:nucleoid-associated protein YgaU
MPTPDKAIIKNLDTGEEITCLFRPSKIVLSKTVTWSTDDSKAGATNPTKPPPRPLLNVPEFFFGGGSAATLDLGDLLFDTTIPNFSGVEPGYDDVRQYTDKLLALTLFNPNETDPKKKRPPLCQFSWGKILSFTMIVESATVTFELFLPDGTPVRARVKLGLKQYKDEKLYLRQNPTSRSEVYNTWVVQAGERLDWIAYQAYGDPSLWRLIAQANSLTDPLDLHSGQILKIVPAH